MADFFISHAEEDRDIALEVAQGLEQAGHTTWYYERDSLPGPTYLAQVGQAIDEARAIVLIISSASLESNHVHNEVVRAYESQLPFLPLLRDVTHADLQRRQPTIRQALGASTSVQIPAEGVGSIIPRLVAGAHLLGIDSAGHTNPTHSPASSRAEGARPSRADEAILRALYVCFDRPAFRVHFEHETDLEALIAALDDTIGAINTGTTKTRDGVTFGERVKGKAYLDSDYLAGRFDEIVLILCEAKRVFADGKRNGYFFPCWSGLAFHRDHQAEAMGLAVKIDDLRNRALTIANEVYSTLGLRPFPLIETPREYRGIAGRDSESGWLRNPVEEQPDDE